MKKVAVVYWSGTGNTQAMAHYVAEGVTAAGGEAVLLSPAEFTPDLVSAFDAIAFGCPAMGSEQLEDMEFEPMFSAVLPSLPGKPIGLFGSYSWADGEWMRTWQADCENANCTLVQDGLACYDAPDDAAAESCRALGRALAG